MFLVRLFSAIGIFIVATFLSATVFASVAGEVNKANALYKQGKLDDALELYQKAFEQDDHSSVVNYDLGTALYKKGDYAKALGYLEEALKDKNFKIKAKAEYNLGNVLYQTGVGKEKADVSAAIKTLQEALNQYGQSLRDDPSDADTKFNQNIVKKEIERLKQQKQQQQNQQQNNPQGPQNQKNQQRQQGQQNKNQQENRQQQNQQQIQQTEENKTKGQQNQAAQASKAQQKQGGQSQPQESQKEIDRQQAQDLLEEYQENEEPKKLLSYMPQKIDNRPVLKDW